VPVPPGSAAVLLGSTWRHCSSSSSGSGSSSSSSGSGSSSGSSSLALEATYTIGQLRSPTDMFAENPPAVARHYPTCLQKLVGYTRRGGALGYFADEQHPAEVSPGR
jgi:hypothetical protein